MGDGKVKARESFFLSVCEHRSKDDGSCTLGAEKGMGTKLMIS